MTAKNSKKKTLLELFQQDRQPALDESPSLSFSLLLFSKGVQAGAPPPESAPGMTIW